MCGRLAEVVAVLDLADEVPAGLAERVEVVAVERDGGQCQGGLRLLDALGQRLAGASLP